MEVRMKLVYVAPVVESCRVELEGVVAVTMTRMNIASTFYYEDYVEETPLQAPDDIYITF
jgi:hypothetical protein